LTSLTGNVEQQDEAEKLVILTEVFQKIHSSTKNRGAPPPFSDCAKD
jgi:hypothetical protein